ncbi:hypothetical protein [Marinitenerispora sediminis]|uniref:Uncharacterized protein n=1 Tax=Marinitenerispora sediminis TaxID=1931232 RepID=A0A368T8J3_9ACTN|nr:hypothetical protein [Marinitenerispora sediminis]RCV57774.1 hypothetical protein DEF28_01005 [Marinitenerispora sediminis]RCV57906.1 hypothetical protein DEF23_09870 [Marinitenerispora sediminis]RCV60659.1 hypothetical protein DEF24_06600 [Marinitenerispora sediminis]
MPDASRPSGRAPTLDSVAARVVAQVAPEETAHYPQVRDEYFERGRANRAEDNPLGFGEIVVGAITGIVLGALHELAEGTLTDVLRPWWDRAWRRLAARLRIRRAEPVAPETALPVLAPDQLPHIAAALTAYCVRSGLPPEQAAELTRAIVAELTAPRAVDGGSGAESGG